MESSKAQKYWEHIGAALEEELGQGHPAVWKKKYVKDFLAHRLSKKVKEAYLRNPEVKTILDVSYDAIETLMPSYDTFRRIFRTKETVSSLLNQNLFAIYHGKLSYDDYTDFWNIKGDIPPKSNNQTPTPPKTEKSPKKSKKGKKKRKKVIVKDNATYQEKVGRYFDMKGADVKYFEKVSGQINFHANQKSHYKILTQKGSLALIEEDGNNFYVENNQGKLNFETRRAIPDVLTTLPKLHSEQLVNRIPELRRLHYLLQQSQQIIAIQSPKGIGKTTLVKYYLEVYKSIYNHIAWIDVQETVIKAIATNSQLKDSLLLEAQQADDWLAFQQMTNILRQLGGNNLLIVDNAGQDVEHTEVYDNLKLDKHWKVVVTTTESDLEDFTLFPLQPLSALDLTQLFQRHYTKPMNHEIVQQIIQRLDHNTGDVAFVAKRAKALRLKLSEVLERLRTSGLDSFEPTIT